jgi:hypothetical protein
MPIPPLTDEGYLPAGVHDCTMDEVDERFARFQRTDRRIRLFEKLVRYVKEVRSTGMVLELLIDGNFTTAKDEPEDIDLILVLNPDHDFAAELRPFEYNALSKKRVRQNYRFDMVAVARGSPDHDKALAFFQQIRESEFIRKGILRVVLS